MTPDYSSQTHVGGPGFYTGRQPHRGVLILVLGIAGILAFFGFGIAAWVMGNSDLQAMKLGMMDDSGRDMTNVVRILGMVSVGLAALGAILVMIFISGMITLAASHPGGPVFVHSGTYAYSRVGPMRMGSTPASIQGLQMRPLGQSLPARPYFSPAQKDQT